MGIFNTRLSGGSKADRNRADAGGVLAGRGVLAGVAAERTTFENNLATSLGGVAYAAVLITDWAMSDGSAALGNGAVTATAETLGTEPFYNFELQEDMYHQVGACVGARVWCVCGGMWRRVWRRAAACSGMWRRHHLPLLPVRHPCMPSPLPAAVPVRAAPQRQRRAARVHRRPALPGRLRARAPAGTQRVVRSGARAAGPADSAGPGNQQPRVDRHQRDRRYVGACLGVCRGWMGAIRPSPTIKWGRSAQPDIQVRHHN